MSNNKTSPPEPLDLDEKIYGELQIVAAAASLRGHPIGDQRCDNCEYYLEPDASLSYCWHPKLRVLVGDRWWCQWWSEIPVTLASANRGSR